MSTRKPEPLDDDPSEAEPEVIDQDYKFKKSRLTKLVNWGYLLLAYVPYLFYGLLALIGLQLLQIILVHKLNLQDLVSVSAQPIVHDLGWPSMLLALAFLYWLQSGEKAVFLLDFETFEPPEEWKVSKEEIMEMMRRQNCFTEESLEFMERLLQNSQPNNKLAWPKCIVKCLQDEYIDPVTDTSREEFQEVVFPIVREVLRRTKLRPKDVDILIVNCSLFSPTPSLCAMVVNEFGFRSDVLSYNLSGMGCSAGIIAVDLAKRLLNAQANATALVVSTEITSQCLYKGNERSFLVQNTLFRAGGAALVLSNKWRDAFRAQFKLLKTMRTQEVGEEAEKAVYQTEDGEGIMGVSLSKEVVKVAGKAMEKNLTRIGAYVLPLSEQLHAVYSILVRKLVKWLNHSVPALKGVLPRTITPYMPDFKRGLDYFCIHAGGKRVIDGVEGNLQLTPENVAPSRYALDHYGNTSSSSIWYEMDYIRKKTPLKKGQRILQVAFGSGFKCNSAVWISLNPPKK